MSPPTVRPWKEKKIFWGQTKVRKTDSDLTNNKTSNKVKILSDNWYFHQKYRKSHKLQKRYQRKKKHISEATVHRYLKTTSLSQKAYRSKIKSLLSKKNIEESLKFGEIV